VDNQKRLDKILHQEKSWAIHQFEKDENGNNLESKELFPQIPTPLVIDFFSTNTIDELNLNNESQIFLKTTGIDKIQWSYILIPPHSNS